MTNQMLGLLENAAWFMVWKDDETYTINLLVNEEMIPEIC